MSEKREEFLAELSVKKDKKPQTTEETQNSPYKYLEDLPDRANVVMAAKMIEREILGNKTGWPTPSDDEKDNK